MSLLLALTGSEPIPQQAVEAITYPEGRKQKKRRRRFDDVALRVEIVEEKPVEVVEPEPIIELRRLADNTQLYKLVAQNIVIPIELKRIQDKLDEEDIEDILMLI